MNTEKTITVIENVNQFRKFVTHAKQGQTCQYYRGYLLRDRSRNVPGAGQKDKTDLELADLAQEFLRNGLVNLVQRREGEFDYLYFAVRTSRRPNDSDAPVLSLVAA